MKNRRFLWFCYDILGVSSCHWRSDQFSNENSCDCRQQFLATLTTIIKESKLRLYLTFKRRPFFSLHIITSKSLMCDVVHLLHCGVWVCFLSIYFFSVIFKFVWFLILKTIPMRNKQRMNLKISEEKKEEEKWIRILKIKRMNLTWKCVEVNWLIFTLSRMKWMNFLQVGDQNELTANCWRESKWSNNGFSWGREAKKKVSKLEFDCKTALLR